MKQVISIRMALSWVALILVFMACKVVEKAKTGADAFNRKQYFISAALYEKEFEANSNQSSKAKLAYGAAVSHQKINETAQAMQWFKEAANLDFGDVAWKEYGLAQIQLGDYEGAIRTFETVLNKKGNSEEFKLLVSTARQGLMMAQEKLNIYNVVPLALNTAASEYAPSIDPKGNLVFTSDRPSVTGEDVYKWTGRKFSDLFSGQADGPETISFSADLNTVANEGTSVLTIAEMLFYLHGVVLPLLLQMHIVSCLSLPSMEANGQSHKRCHFKKKRSTICIPVLQPMILSSFLCQMMLEARAVRIFIIQSGMMINGKPGTTGSKNKLCQ